MAISVNLASSLYDPATGLMLLMTGHNPGNLAYLFHLTHDCALYEHWLAMLQAISDPYCQAVSMAVCLSTSVCPQDSYC